MADLEGQTLCAASGELEFLDSLKKATFLGKVLRWSCAGEVRKLNRSVFTYDFGKIGAL
jgi:hypothetical protein